MTCNCDLTNMICLSNILVMSFKKDLPTASSKLSYYLFIACSRDLESTVEELRGNVINRKTRVNMSDVENMALVLSKSR